MPRRRAASNRRIRAPKSGRKQAEGLGLGPSPPGGFNAVSVQRGKVYVATTTSSNLGRINLSPSVDARLTTLSSLYELYKFTWLKVTLFPTDNATSNGHAFGFVPDYPSGSAGVPTTQAQVVELPHSLLMVNRMIQPQFITIPRAGLMGRNAIKWFQTDQSTPSEESIQGSMYFWADQATLTINVLIEYQLEFTNPVPAQVTLARTTPSSLIGTAIDNLSVDQKVALLRRIASKDTSPPTVINHRE